MHAARWVRFIGFRTGITTAGAVSVGDPHGLQSSIIPADWVRFVGFRMRVSPARYPGLAAGDLGAHHRPHDAAVPAVASSTLTESGATRESSGDDRCP